MRKQNMQEVSKEIALGLWSIGYGEFSHVRVSFFLFFFLELKGCVARSMKVEKVRGGGGEARALCSGARATCAGPVAGSQRAGSQRREKSQKRNEGDGKEFSTANPLTWKE